MYQEKGTLPFSTYLTKISPGQIRSKLSNVWKHVEDVHPLSPTLRDVASVVVLCH
jgi:hypothetical protein